jgi:hypothetical protein
MIPHVNRVHRIPSVGIAVNTIVLLRLSWQRVKQRECLLSPVVLIKAQTKSRTQRHEGPTYLMVKSIANLKPEKGKKHLSLCAVRLNSGSIPSQRLFFPQIFFYKG